METSVNEKNKIILFKQIENEVKCKARVQTRYKKKLPEKLIKLLLIVVVAVRLIVAASLETIFLRGKNGRI